MTLTSRSLWKQQNGRLFNLHNAILSKYNLGSLMVMALRMRGTVEAVVRVLVQCN